VATSSLTPRAIGLGLHPFEKLGEIAAAGRRLRHGRCGGEACENKGEGKLRCHDGVNS
jgi:hypothetical protein